MKCPKCGLQMRVKSTIITDNVLIQKLTCVNPNCPNKGKITEVSYEVEEESETEDK